MLSLEKKSSQQAFDCSTNLGCKRRCLSHHNPCDEAESRSVPGCLCRSSAAVLALAGRCYPGLPRKPADAAPAALPLHELRVQRGTESCSSSSRQDCHGAVLRFSSPSPPFPSPHRVQAPPHRTCFPPPSFQLTQCTRRSFLSHHFHPGSLSPRCCVTALQAVGMFWTFYWSFFHCRGSLDIDLFLQAQRELEML